MKTCRDCNTKTDEDKCPDCGAPLGEVREDQELSVVDASLDQLMEKQGSVPSLATLFKQGQANGLITPTQEYK